MNLFNDPRWKSAVVQLRLTIKAFRKQKKWVLFESKAVYWLVGSRKTFELSEGRILQSGNILDLHKACSQSPDKFFEKLAMARCKLNRFLQIDRKPENARLGIQPPKGLAGVVHISSHRCHGWSNRYQNRSSMCRRPGDMHMVILILCIVVHMGHR